MQANPSYWNQSAEDNFKSLDTRSVGLSSDDAKERLAKFGENTLKKQKKSSVLVLLLNQFKNPIIVILITATLISGFTGDWTDAAIILTIIVISALLSFYQEYSANHTVEKLRATVQARSIVLRDGKPVEIPSTEVVPGDIVRLSTGSLVPADCLLLRSNDLYVNQAILTGESFPVHKFEGIIDADAPVAECSNCAFMGTNVHSGDAEVLVIKTGQDTEFGKIAKKLTLRPPETEFERGVRHFGYLLTQIMLILTLGIFAINVYFSRPVLEALLFSVALAVGITPQLLPTIISITLSKGSRSMAKEGVIVRRLNAIENFGSMDTLCTDKTGTLTEGVIRLNGAMDLSGDLSEEVFRLAYLNASLQSGMANSLDDTITHYKDLDISGVSKIGEIGFDFTRKRMSVIVEDEKALSPYMITKGAMNQVLEVCHHAHIGGKITPLEGAVLEDIQNRYIAWSNQGIRVLGLGKKEVPARQKYALEDESDMVFMGFLLLQDHPKSDVSDTIQALAANGVSLRVITGDNKLVALHTAEAVGLEVTGVLTGKDLIQLSDEALWHKIETTNLFAEVDPNQKERIILALRKKNHVVGYMGDGINDIPAFHAADVSISVDNAVDVAKEAVDFVLLKNSLAVLNRGVELGRVTFSNTLKYIYVTTSANFGNMFSMAGISLFLPFLPLLPKQILMINFLTDFPAITIANDAVDPEVLARPRRWDIRFIRNYMLVFGVISSLFDYITFAVLFLGFHVHHEGFQSSWFVFSIITELLMLLVMRTRKPFFKSKPAPLLLYSSLFVGILTLFLPYTPIGKFLGLVPIRMGLLLALMGITVLYAVVTEVAKYFFYRNKLEH